MKILVVGGTGMIGAHIATELVRRGHEVVTGSRHQPAEDSLVAGLPFVAGDYSDGGFSSAELVGFDAVVCSASQDVRHVKDEDADDRYWSRYQSDGVPALAARAKQAGVGRFVQIGSCYHMVLPELIETNPYVRARHLADTRARALTGDGFVSCTLNPPPIVGMIPGRSTRGFGRIVAWARSQDAPDFTPPGGTNYLSARSLAQAAAGAVEREVGGEAYLVGDENWTYHDYFQGVVDRAGGTRVLAVRDEEHPFLPDRMVVPGRSRILSYEPDPAVVELLGYRRGDVGPTLDEMVAAV